MEKKDYVPHKDHQSYSNENNVNNFQDIEFKRIIINMFMEQRIQRLINT